MFRSVTEFITGNDKAIVAIVNSEDKKIYLNYTRNLVEYYCKLIKWFNNKTNPHNELQQDLAKLAIYTLETFDDYKDHTMGKFRLNRHFEWYKNEGYTFYNKNFRPIKLTPEIKIESITNATGYRANVYLKQNRNKRILVKTFKYYMDAEHFVADTTIYDMIKIGTHI